MCEQNKHRSDKWVFIYGGGVGLNQHIVLQKAWCACLTLYLGSTSQL